MCRSPCARITRFFYEGDAVAGGDESEEYSAAEKGKGDS